MSANARPAPEYDAATGPDRRQWLAAGTSRRLEAIHRHHQATGPEPADGKPHLHALVHYLVENQVAAADPPEAAAALERLRAEGLDRHDAVHVIAAAIVRYIADPGDATDLDAYVRALPDLHAP
jgi:hypothetical protein